MAAVPRFQRLVNAVTGRTVNPQAGQPGQALADVFDQFAQESAQRFAQERENQATLEGFEAGQTEDELPQGQSFTAAGQAFNTAARLGHLAGVRNDIKASLTTAAIEARTGPAETWVETFKARTDGLRDAQMESLDDLVKADALAYLNETSGNLELKLLDGQTSALHEQNLQELQLGSVNLLDDIVTASRDGAGLELDSIGQKLLAKRQREFEALQLGSVAAGLSSQAQADARIQDMHSKAVTSEMIGAFDQAIESDGLEVAGKRLDEFNRADAVGLGFSAEEKTALETTFRTMWDRERSFQNATQAKDEASSKAVRALNSRANRDAITLLEAGRPADTDVKGLMDSLIEQEQFTEVLKLQDAVAVNSRIVPFMHAPTAELGTALAEMRSSENLNAEDLRVMDKLEGVQRHRAGLLDTDPRTLALEENIIEEDEPLDASSPQAIAASLAARGDSTRTGAEHYEAPMPMITEAEAATLARQLPTLDIDSQLAMAEGIIEGSGTATADTLSMIDAKNAKVWAYAGGLSMIGQRNDAAAVMRGHQAMGDPKLNALPKGIARTELEGHIASRLGSSYALQADTRTTVTNAIKAWYADSSVTDGFFQPDEWRREEVDQAINAVVGNVVEDRTGAQNPLRSGDQDQFDSWIDSLDEDFVESFGGVVGNENDRAAILIRRGRFFGVGDDTFQVGTPDPFSDTPNMLETHAPVDPDIQTLVDHGRGNIARGGAFTDDDGFHSILSGSVQDDRLNGGQITVIPFVFDGKKVSAGEAISRAVKSGAAFPTAESEAEATEISERASRAMDLPPRTLTIRFDPSRARPSNEIATPAGI